MLDDWIGRVDHTERIGPTLRLYLWWGIVIRGVLLVALLTLLVAKGNFLAEWLLAWQIVPGSQVDLREYTTFSYVVLGTVLTAGIYLRWTVIRRMNAASVGENAAPPAETTIPSEADDAEADDAQAEGGGVSSKASGDAPGTSFT